MRYRLRPVWPVLITLALIGCQQPGGGPAVTPIGTPPGPSPSAPPSDRDVLSPTPEPTPETPQTYRVEAFFGTGDIGYWGDGGLAVEATIYKPSSLVGTPDGRIYVSDFGFDTVRYVDLNTGVAHHVYGIQETKDASESVKAAEAPVAKPEGLAFDSKGRLFVAQNGFAGGIPGKIRVIDAVGNTYTFAGGGSEPVTDGAHALSVTLDHPAGIAFDAQDNLYVAENGANRILKISPDRIITIVAGTGEMGFGGDGGPATAAKLTWPQGLVLDPKGRVVFADQYNHRIRRIEKDGTIATIAGGATAGFDGDGGPATAAALNQPGAIAYDAQGNLIIADSNNNVIRRVTPEGVISTIAGLPPVSPEDPEQATTTDASGGDGGAALQAAFDFPSGLYVGSDGAIYVSDHRVRVLKPEP